MVGNVAMKSSKPVLNERELAELIDLIKEHTGITMDMSKKDLIYRRIGSRLKDLQLSCFRDYIKYLKSNSQQELEEFTNAVTTNLTAFFRENQHFEFLKNTVVADLQKANKKSLRIWSAGCSTGEEAYSIGMSLNEAISNLPLWDAKVLATDIDSQVLEKCRSACYDFDRVKDLNPSLLKKYFKKGTRNGKQLVKLKTEVHELISFKRLNLMDPWPMAGSFNVIFCRNVLIYFDEETKHKIAARFVEFLRPGGYLIIGHSERLVGMDDVLDFKGQTIYQKK